MKTPFKNILARIEINLTMSLSRRTKTNSLVLIKRLLCDYLRPYYGQIALAFFFMVISSLMTAAFAKLLQPVLDDVLISAQNDTSSENLIIPMALSVFGCFLVRGIASYIHTVKMIKVGQNIIGDVQKDLFSHFMTLDLKFFHANPSGQLISRVISDVQVMRMAVVDALTGIGTSFLTLIFLLTVMILQDWHLSLIAIFAFIPAAAMVGYLGKRLRKVSSSIQQHTALLADRLSQIFHGIRQVQAYGQENAERARANKAIDQVMNLNIKSVKIGEIATPFNELLVGFSVFGIISYGAYQILDGQLTTGGLMSFIAAFSLAYEPIKKLSKLNNVLQVGLAAAERVFEMLDTKPFIATLPTSKPLVLAAGRAPDIHFEKVVFKYNNDEDRSALKGVTLKIPSGKVTALVGPSGSGKTTIMNLIPRFYDVTSGSVLIEGQDVRDLTVDSLRQAIALVSQDITMFDGSVRDNIRYGKPDATDEQVEEAARAAAAHEFITAMSDGYNTGIGENGVLVSGGQKQRIAIARAILKDAPILLLDEATSALDSESEKAVQASLKILEKGRTTLVIAHRLSTVQNADQIIVLDNGIVSESGNHLELLSSEGVYSRMREAFIA